MKLSNILSWATLAVSATGSATAVPAPADPTSAVTVTVENTSSESQTFSYTYGDGTNSESYTIAAGETQTIDITPDCEFTITLGNGINVEVTSGNMDASSFKCSETDGCNASVQRTDCST